jgi:predicted nucleic acid-binding protein
MRLVLVDTCIWVPFFNRPQSAEKKVVDALLDDDRAVLIGPIVTEILQGIPREAQANHVASLLRGVRCLEMIWDDWLEAARLGRRLAASGHRLPLSDLILAAVSLRLEAEIYSTDPHFDLISELNRFGLAQ